MEIKKEAWEIASSGQGEVKAEGNRITSLFSNAKVRGYPPAARNVVWSGGLFGQAGKAYWKITLEEGNKNCVEVGLTDREKFNTMEGWNCLALVYEMGNLRDGTYSGNDLCFTK